MGDVDTVAEEVCAQQVGLNGLLGPYGFPELTVDGVVGALTRQALGAARLLDHPTHDGNPAAGAAPDRSPRWVLVDKTYQVLIAGEASRGIVFVFPVSTGTPDHETRTVEGVAAFRFEPALERDGWRNSTTFPVGPDHPRGGNMYRPVYFSRGQAIHGSDSITPEPRSQGCVLVVPNHQDALIHWLGLDDVIEPLWSTERIDLSVTVRGAFDPAVT